MRRPRSVTRQPIASTTPESTGWPNGVQSETARASVSGSVEVKKRTMPVVEKQLRAAEKTMLVVYAGLLARYDQMELLSQLSQKVGRSGGIPGLWLLIPGDNNKAVRVPKLHTLKVLGPPGVRFWMTAIANPEERMLPRIIGEAGFAEVDRLPAGEYTIYRNKDDERWETSVVLPAQTEVRIE